MTSSVAPLTEVSTFFWRHKALLTLVLVLPPVLWFGVVYCGSLFGLLLHSFFTIDDFTMEVVREPTLSTWKAMLNEPANFDITVRTVQFAVVTTLTCAMIAFPIAYTMARFASGRAKALYYLLVMLPMWTGYLVKVYAWRLLLAKEGIVSWCAQKLHLTWLLDGVLSLPVVGGTSLSSSALGTILVFTYLWLPYMILPIQAALERIPPSVLQASADLGARPSQTFRTVTLPLALPGVVAGSIFTFSLTLGDYIVPALVGPTGLTIGQAVYTQQGTNNLPLAAAFSVVPIAVMGIYLAVAKRLGAFDAL
jgi:putative spermidine/putrescine transport system permease protein